MDPVNSFRIFFLSSIILMAVAVPTVYNNTNYTSTDLRNKRDIDSCEAVDGHRSNLQLKLLEKRGYCHYKVCEDKYGNKNGKTRNPDVIYTTICEEKMNCSQVYLTIDVAFYANGLSTRNRTEVIPVGCIYSVTDLRDSTTLEETESAPLV